MTGTEPPPPAAGPPPDDYPPSYRAALDALPAALRPSAARAADALRDAGALPELDDAPARALVTVWALSDYAADICRREPGLLAELLASGELERGLGGGYAGRFAAFDEELSDAAFTTALRRCREREMLRIVWRDLNRLVDLDTTLAELSAFADAAIDAALNRGLRQLCARHGTPRDADRPSGDARLVVLGMGKLGGGELNFSSDIDLLFAYTAAGATDGARSIDNETFFRQLTQRVVALLSGSGERGRVFRVDLRLRPFGSAGPVAVSFSACEAYYQSHGRGWERYALVKARPVAGDRAAGDALLETLRPFVYRRYLDYSAFASLREMKTLIAAEVKRKGFGDDVKLGPGGIREIEFIAQAFQLIYGGHEAALRDRGLRATLRALADAGHLDASVVAELDGAYVFLRDVENRLQMVADRQTHRLPTAGDGSGRLRLAWGMGFDDWDGFAAALAGHRRRVSAQFDRLVAWPDGDGGCSETFDPDGNPDALRETLRGYGFEDPEATLERLRGFTGGSALRALSAAGHGRLRRLLPALLTATAAYERPDQTLSRLLPLLQTIAKRVVYLDLLLDRPVVRAQLVKLCAASPWISEYLSRHPLLLDELLEPETLYRPFDVDALETELRRALAGAGEDVERRLDALRHVKHRSELHVAAADIAGVLPLMRVSDRLSDIAETLLRRALALAWDDLAARFGQPRARAGGNDYRPRLALVGYGKLGGLELGYGSDLDVVFLHDSEGDGQHTDGARELDNTTFFNRLAQRVMYYLHTTTAAGRLYEIDTRLRPSGRAGLLVTSFGAFERYQREQAWTWEQQALVRARCVAGPDALAERFETLRRALLCRPRERATLRSEVADMRAKMRAKLGSREPGRWHLKHDRGGIVDIEFIAQYLVLAHAAEHPGLAEYSDNMRQFDAAERAGLLDAGRAGRLRGAYAALRDRSHRLRLQQQPELIDGDDPLSRYRDDIAALWDELFGAAAPGG